MGREFLVPDLARESAFSLPSWPVWAFTHLNVTVLFLAIEFQRKTVLRTKELLILRELIACRELKESEWIVIVSFFRRSFIHCSPASMRATISAWKTVFTSLRWAISSFLRVLL